MSIIKRMLAGVTATVMILSLFGCGQKTTWAAKTGDSKINAGVFIYYEITAYYEALDKLKKDDETITKVSEDMTVEEKGAKDWIQNRATELMQQYVAIDNKFDELGLKLTDKDLKNVDSIVDYYNGQMKDYYSGNGISDESLELIFKNNFKKSAIFEKYYLKDGIEAVAESDVEKYFVDNYARVKTIEVKLKDGSGNLLKSPEKEKAIEMAQDYLKRAKDGEDFDSLIAEYDAYYNKLVEDAKEAATATTTTAATTTAKPSGSSETTTTAAETTTSSGSDTTTSATTTVSSDSTTNAAATTTAAGTEATTTKYTNEKYIKAEACKNTATSFSYDDKNTVTVYNTDTYSPDVISAVFKAEYKVPTLVQDDEVYYVVLRLDNMECKDIFEKQHDSFIHALKDDDFDKLIESFASSIEMTKNDDAYERYTPFKLKYQE